MFTCFFVLPYLLVNKDKGYQRPLVKATCYRQGLILYCVLQEVLELQVVNFYSASA